MAQSITDLRISTNCTQCLDKCCSQSYDWVYLTEAESSALELASGRRRDEFITQRSNQATGATFTVLNLPCTFLDKASGKCSIYESRPLICRLFPFYPEPLTGHAALLPAQCGENLIFETPASGKGWTLDTYKQAIETWVRTLWDEAATRRPG